jgi:hypothetical protein
VTEGVVQIETPKEGSWFLRFETSAQRVILYCALSQDSSPQKEGEGGCSSALVSDYLDIISAGDDVSVGNEISLVISSI